LALFKSKAKPLEDCCEGFAATVVPKEGAGAVAVGAPNCPEDIPNENPPPDVLLAAGATAGLAGFWKEPPNEKDPAAGFAGVAAGVPAEEPKAKEEIGFVVAVE